MWPFFVYRFAIRGVNIILKYNSMEFLQSLVWAILWYIIILIFDCKVQIFLPTYNIILSDKRFENKI